MLSLLRLGGILLLPGLVYAQLIPPGSPLPRTAKPPVVFLNGYQNDCTGATFAGTFGLADRVLQDNGQVSVFFNNCSFADRPSIEGLGQSFGQFLAGLRYDDGTPVQQLDAVAHSMGGLILRSYLSGKTPDGGLQPPQATRIRKAIFLATPHFGTPVGALFGIDRQVTALAPGSRFLFDLATWNQGTDDLRGVDAISVLGNAGTGRGVLGLGSGVPRSDDGVVSLYSGSLRFFGLDRTRILPYCHTGPGLVTVSGLCPAGAPGIAEIQSAGQDTARLITSFLNGTAEWQSIGAGEEQNEYLGSRGAVMLQVLSADERSLPADADANGSTRLNTGASRDVGYLEGLAAGTVTLEARTNSVRTTVNLPAGGYTTLTLKPGPRVYRVFPAASPVFPITVAPAQIVAIYGDNLEGAQVTVGGAAVTQFYRSATQINALLPASASGMVRLAVQTTAGTHTVNVLAEPAVPAIFTQDSSGAGPASALNARNYQLVSAGNPLRAGDYAVLYLTGLGQTTNRGGLEYANLTPSVELGGAPCEVTYAGRAPGFPGLDQINCRVTRVTRGGKAEVRVSVNGRTSNTATVDVE